MTDNASQWRSRETTIDLRLDSSPLGDSDLPYFIKIGFTIGRRIVLSECVTVHHGRVYAPFYFDTEHDPFWSNISETALFRSDRGIPAFRSDQSIHTNHTVPAPTTVHRNSISVIGNWSDWTDSNKKITFQVTYQGNVLDLRWIIHFIPCGRIHSDCFDDIQPTNIGQNMASFCMNTIGDILTSVDEPEQDTTVVQRMYRFRIGFVDDSNWNECDPVYAPEMILTAEYTSQKLSGTVGSLVVQRRVIRSARSSSARPKRSPRPRRDTSRTPSQRRSPRAQTTTRPRSPRLSKPKSPRLTKPKSPRLSQRIVTK